LPDLSAWGAPGLSWPLFEHGARFELGHILNCAVADAIEPPQVGGIGFHHAGLWECDLADNSLVWSGGVYDLFGLERLRPITRQQALAHYSEDSRAKLERLRGHAIRNKVGFTIDVEIRAAAVGRTRHVRIIGAPVYDNGKPVRVHGLKLIV